MDGGKIWIINRWWINKGGLGFKIQRWDNKIYLKKLLTLEVFYVIHIISKGLRAFDVVIKFFI